MLFFVSCLVKPREIISLVISELWTQFRSACLSWYGIYEEGGNFKHLILMSMPKPILSSFIILDIHDAVY